MSEINTIADIQILLSQNPDRDWSEFGDVNTKRQGSLILFTYSRACNSKPRSEWNFFERVSRGLILDVSTLEVVARPFDKFWNWIPEQGEMTTAEIKEITEKMDGSLGILYRENGELKIATKGSFTSDQALWATEKLKEFNLSDLPNSLTLMFEIIYPDNRILVDYLGAERLVLIGVRDRHTGEDYTADQMRAIAEQFGLDMVEVIDGTPEELVEKALEIPAHESEGWVMRFEDGTRWKLKGRRYLELHRIVSFLSEDYVAEAFAFGISGELSEINNPDIQPIIDQYVKTVISKLAMWRSILKQAYNDCKARASMAAEPGTPEYNREFAREVLTGYPKNYHSALFAAKNGQDIDPHIYYIEWGIHPAQIKQEREQRGSK